VLKNRILGTFTALALAVASVGVGANAAHADDDDRVTCSGYGTKNAQYRLTLAERDDDRMRTRLAIDTNVKNKKWTVKVYRDGTKVHQASKRTGKKGNVTFAKTVRGDDDHRYRVVATTKGQKIVRTIALDDDLECRSGKGSKGSRYGYSVTERDDDRATAQLRVNGPKKNARWNVSYYRDGKKVASATKRANRYGNVTVTKTFRADDDHRIKVVAKSGYGERITRTIDLDD